MPTLPFINNIFYFDVVCAVLREAGVFRWFIMRGDFVQTSFLFIFIYRVAAANIYFIYMLDVFVKIYLYQIQYIKYIQHEHTHMRAFATRVYYTKLVWLSRSRVALAQFASRCPSVRSIHI